MPPNLSRTLVRQQRLPRPSPLKRVVVRAKALDWPSSLVSIPRSRRRRIGVAKMMDARLRGSRLATIVVSVIVLMSCATEEHVGTLTLSDGSKITHLLANESCSVVLVMSPQECLSCSGILETWVERGRELQFELHFLLTSSPSAKQVEALRLRRVPFRGVVSGPHATSEPRAYLLAGGVMTDSIVGLAQQTVVLSQLISVRRGDDSKIDQACLWNTIEMEGVTNR